MTRAEKPRAFVDIYDKKGSEVCRFNKDSRGIVRKAQSEMEKLGFTQTRFGPEIEFFVFDSIRLFPAANSMWSSGTVGYSIKSVEAPWSQENTSLDPKDGYYTAKPKDTLDTIRKDICDDIHRYFGVNVEAHHHEVASSGQCEINIRHDQMLPMADMIISIKNLIKMKARHYAKSRRLCQNRFTEIMHLQCTYTIASLRIRKMFSMIRMIRLQASVRLQDTTSEAYWIMRLPCLQ